MAREEESDLASKNTPRTADLAEEHAGKQIPG
jgi:hypothetical protein